MPGFVFTLLASIGCALAASVNALIVLRLLQALGGCVGMVAARAMVRDLFEVKENAKVFSTADAGGCRFTDHCTDIRRLYYCCAWAGDMYL